MFEVGFWELVLIGVIALIVIGPEQLPSLARTAGLWLGKARRMMADIKAEVDRELHLEEIKQTLRQQVNADELPEVKELSRQMKAIHQDLQDKFSDPAHPPGGQPGLASTPPPAPASTTPPESGKPDSDLPPPPPTAN